MAGFALAGSLVSLTGCMSVPDSYPVPVQHSPVSAPPVLAEPGTVSVTDPRAADFFVQDLNGPRNGVWLWTGQNPKLRLPLDDITRRRAVVEFTINQTTFKDTGPLRVHYWVNGHLLDSAIYNAPGDQTFEKAVPEEWLRENAGNELLIQIENPWIAPDDGAKLGVLLRRAGFVQ